MEIPRKRGNAAVTETSVNFRLPVVDRDRIDELAEEHDVTRSDAIRHLLRSALDALPSEPRPKKIRSSNGGSRRRIKVKNT